MDYQNYEDYMRQVLGYSPNNPNIYENYRQSEAYDDTYFRNESVNVFTEEEANEFYPQIYSVVNPMVCKVCEQAKRSVYKRTNRKNDGRSI